jgi:DNA ligase D
VASAASGAIEVEAGGRLIRVTSPDKVYFAARGDTKLDVVRYFVAVEEGILRAVRHRPVALHRFPAGVGGKSFYHKRIADTAPDWLESIEVRFPSARPGALLCPADLAHVIWAVNQGGFELHPWPVVRGDVEHPVELRIDLDPQPGCGFAMVRTAAHGARELCREHGLAAFPKLSGSKGIHLHVPIAPEWDFTAVRNACLALARELERRMPKCVTAAWWKEQRGSRVFVDFNQNLRDKTIVAAYAVRPLADAPVACPIEWGEIDTVEQRDFTIATVPARLATRGDPHAALAACAPGRLDSLLELHARDLAAGIPDAPWPPHYPKQAGEPRRSRELGTRN